MIANINCRNIVVLCLFACALPGVLLAAEPERKDKNKDASEPTVVVLGDDGEQLTLTLTDGQLTIITDQDGHSRTSILDMEAMGLLAADAVDEALVGFEDVLAEIGRMQFQYRAGQDNRVNLSFDDTEFELDLDQVMAQVSSAVQLGLAEINTGDWASSRGRWDDVSDDELKDELENLRSEMKELQRELQRLKQEKDGR